MEKVIPRGLDYGSLKPEAIECNIKMIKVTPTATTHNAQQNDIVQFQLMGLGFLDPYSTYLKFSVDTNVDFPEPSFYGGCNMKILDRSAHSFIQRWVLRSNGVEIERIENYDVMAAMVNDVMYSREQTSIHFNEGFPTTEVPAGLGVVQTLKARHETFPTDAGFLGDTLRHSYSLGRDNSNYVFPNSLGFVGPPFFHNQNAHTHLPRAVNVPSISTQNGLLRRINNHNDLAMYPFYEGIPFLDLVDRRRLLNVHAANAAFNDVFLTNDNLRFDIRRSVWSDNVDVAFQLYNNNLSIRPPFVGAGHNATTGRRPWASHALDYAFWDYEDTVLNSLKGNRNVTPVGEVAFFKKNLTCPSKYMDWIECISVPFSRGAANPQATEAEAILRGGNMSDATEANFRFQFLQKWKQLFIPIEYDSVLDAYASVPANQQRYVINQLGVEFNHETGRSIRPFQGVQVANFAFGDPGANPNNLHYAAYNPPSNVHVSSGTSLHKLYRGHINNVWGMYSVLIEGANFKREAGLIRTQGVKSFTQTTFTIPLYSGLLGIFMPDKKLLPLSIMPLQLELTLNPHALYCVSNDIALLDSPAFQRNYIIRDIQICGHMLTFEQEVHRSLETIIAANGLMIHFNTFYLTPTMVHNAGSLPAYAQINMAFKSIKSIHFMFYYSCFVNEKWRRKLHFVSHRLSKLQLRNGIELMPSEPIEGRSHQNYDTITYGLNGAVDVNLQTKQGSAGQNQFYIEMLKSWNKMHDIATDSQVSARSFAVDTLPSTEFARFHETMSKGYISDAFPQRADGFHAHPEFNPFHVYQREEFQYYMFRALIQDQLEVGRCCYGMALEGEELGQDKSIITGRKGQLPFDLNMVGSSAFGGVNGYHSFMNTFLFLDMMVYVRPDLIITVLGK